MSNSTFLTVFNLDDRQYALYLSSVQRVVRAVEITPLPKGPEIVSGVVNVRGDIVPVFNVRKRFGLREKEMELSDMLVIARTSKQLVGLMADSVSGVVSRKKEEIVPSEEILSGLNYVDGVVKLEDGLVLIHNLDRFLSLEETQKLKQALSVTG